MYILHVTPARGRSYSKTLQEEALVIGRSLSCDLIIEDQEISRRHAILALENDQLFLEDLDSHNGTLLNEKQVTGRVKIKPESTIRLSGNTITITKMDSLKDLRKEPTKTYGEKSLFRDASDILNQRETQDVQSKDEESLRVFASRLSCSTKSTPICASPFPANSSSTSSSNAPSNTSSRKKPAFI